MIGAHQLMQSAQILEVGVLDSDVSSSNIQDRGMNKWHNQPLMG